MDRFGSSAADSIADLVNKSKNLNTTKATNNWMGVYISWATVRGREKQIETLAPKSLDTILQQFYAEVKKQNGEGYEPSSLAAMHAGIERHLRNLNY